MLTLRCFIPIIFMLSNYGWKILKLIGLRFFAALRAENIGVNVHYLPVYLHSYYKALGYSLGSCPVAEKVYDQILSLPIFSTMTEEDVENVIVAFNKVLSAYVK